MSVLWNQLKAKQMEWEPSLANFLTPEIIFLAFDASLLSFTVYTMCLGHYISLGQETLESSVLAQFFIKKFWSI